MKFLKLLLSMLCLLTLNVHASSQKEANKKDDYNSFLLEAHQYRSGTMWYQDKVYLYSEFNITISNTEKISKTIPYGTCIIVFDKNSDNQILASGIDPELLEPYKPYESKTGRVIFRSADSEVQSLRFIKMSNDRCHSSESNVIIKK
ncbi:hypothetical protein ACI2JI_22605 [Enterobacter cancerogenus]|uniref:hypothetical protein n=1 Tax=Enterobacter cancerogenus TaxID=69218 RepID=UPI0038500598